MAQTAAQKKAAIAKAAAAKKEKAYIDSFSNPITSQYDTRIAQNMGVSPAISETRPNEVPTTPAPVVPTT